MRNDWLCHESSAKATQAEKWESWVSFANRKLVYIHMWYEGWTNEYDDDSSHTSG